MYSVDLAFDVSVLNAHMAALDAALDDMSSPLELIADDVQHRVFKEQFDTEGGRANAWQPLAPEYAAWKARHFAGAPILVRTGAMRADFLGEGEGSIRRVTRDSLEVGATSKFARFHQTGTGRMPARPPIDATDQDHALWAGMVMDGIRNAWGNA